MEDYGEVNIFSNKIVSKGKYIDSGNKSGVIKLYLRLLKKFLDKNGVI